MRDYYMLYRGSVERAGGDWQRAGALAVSALNSPRAAVSMLDGLYSGRRDRLTAERLADAVAALDCVQLCTDGRSEDADENGGVVDDLIAFRVYARHFLTKFCGAHKDGGEALERFRESLPALTAQLRRDSNVRRTTLPTRLRATTEFQTIGGAVARQVGFGSLGELLLYDLLYALEQGCAPCRCPSCGRFFTPEKGNVVYCDGPAPNGDGRTCRELGAGREHAKRVAADQSAQLWKAACGRIYTRKSRGRLTAEEADALLMSCSALLEQARRGELDNDELDRRLRETTAAKGGGEHHE